MHARLEEQRSWYAAKSAFNKSRYRLFQIITIIASAAIPVINLTSGWGDSGTQHGALLATSIISAGVAIVIAFTQLEKYFETWILYRTTAESLKREKLLFQNNCGEYSNLAEVDKDRLLVERVEASFLPRIRNFLRCEQTNKAVCRLHNQSKILLLLLRLLLLLLLHNQSKILLHNQSKIPRNTKYLKISMSLTACSSIPSTTV